MCGAAEHSKTGANTDCKNHKAQAQHKQILLSYLYSRNQLKAGADSQLIEHSGQEADCVDRFHRPAIRTVARPTMKVFMNKQVLLDMTLAESPLK